MALLSLALSDTLTVWLMTHSDRSFENPFKFSFAGPGRITRLMQLGMRAGVQDTSSDVFTQINDADEQQKQHV